MSDITQILSRAGEGEPGALDQLMPMVYEELRRIAAHRMSMERPGQTLQPTALVHEAWLRLGNGDPGGWSGRAHFFSAAAEAMRRILIDRARARRTLKRGEGAVAVPIDSVEIPVSSPEEEHLAAVGEAVEKLARVEPRKAELVKLRYFAGMTFEEAAGALGIAVPTAKQWWSFCRAWLKVELAGDGSL